MVTLQENHETFATLTSRNTSALHSNVPQRTMERAAHQGDGKNWWYAGTLTRNAPLTVYEPNSLSGFGSQSQLASEFEEVSRFFVNIFLIFFVDRCDGAHVEDSAAQTNEQMPSDRRDRGRSPLPLRTSRQGPGREGSPEALFLVKIQSSLNASTSIKVHATHERAAIVSLSLLIYFITRQQLSTSQ